MSKIITVGNKKQDVPHAQHKCTIACGWGGRMSTPAVRIVVTGRRANTNVINTSALTFGTSNVTICLWWILQVCSVPEPLLPNGHLGTALSHFPSKQCVPVMSGPQVLTHEWFGSKLIAIITNYHRVKSYVQFVRNKQPSVYLKTPLLPL